MKSFDSQSVCPDHPLYELFRQLVHLARDKITAEKERVNDFPELSTLDTSKACELGSLAPTTSDLKKSLADKSIKSMAKFRMSMVHVSTGRVLQSPVEIVVLHDSILIVNRESHQRYLMFSPILGANICVSTQNETAKVFELLISGKQRIEFSSESPVETWVVHIRECCKNAVTEHKDNLRIPPDTVEELSTTPKSSTFPRPPHRTPNRGTVKPLQPGEPVDFSSPRLEPSRYPTRRAPSPDRSRLAPPSLLPHISPSEPPQLPLLEFGLKSLLSSDSSRSLPHSALERPSVPRSRTSGSPNRKNIAPSESERKQGIKSENSRSRQACQTLCFIAAVAFFWREGDWRRLVSGSTAVTIRHDVGHGVMQVMHIDTGDMLVNADMLPTNSVKRVDLTSVSIGCDIGSNKELYLFRAGTSKEADLLLQSLNMTKLALTPMPLESQPPMSWTAAPRKLSFGSSSSLASYSTASTNVTVPSFVNQQSLPALSSSAVMLSEEKIKIFLRIDAGMWKTLGTARLQFHGTSEAKASHLIIVTGKKQNNKSVTIIDASLRETACERVGKTGVMLSVMNGSRIVTWMVQGKNDDEAKKLLERIKAGKHI
ncbi:hypothetical protein NEOLI_004060 [Neolecta irregularis DAH-3]|uniref:Uncharacterized protein n=1 Tax=Neolecta irregularis (strain DAH-3) TaxID=1198029 RepID=A0A1U7LSL7_NEOID|nr:hypothetical protein NEOLI_004060 [Neolecta irregularis DAH-3]|eukprot:OLL25608.1 hypothetical protein NEOLI_004060 [Neolecta irregularis DAH-3]